MIEQLEAECTRPMKELKASSLRIGWGQTSGSLRKKDMNPCACFASTYINHVNSSNAITHRHPPSEWAKIRSPSRSSRKRLVATWKRNKPPQLTAFLKRHIDLTHLALARATSAHRRFPSHLNPFCNQTRAKIFELPKRTSPPQTSKATVPRAPVAGIKAANTEIELHASLTRNCSHLNSFQH